MPAASQGFLPVKLLRNCIPIFGMLSLFLLFFQMVDASQLAGLLGCKNCAMSNPFLILMGAGYFAALISISLLFPNFPNRQIARAGLLWAILLVSGLTYLHLPQWCAACMIGHFFHLLIWTIWVIVPAPKSASPPPFFKERIYFLLLSPLIVICLFSSLNVLFLIYHFQDQDEQDLAVAPSFKSGDKVPPFILETTKGDKITHEHLTKAMGTVINFVTSNCPYSNQQLPIVNSVALQFSHAAYRFINVSSTITDDLMHKASAFEWAEDKKGDLHQVFNVRAYPTTFIIGKDGIIKQVILGQPEKLEANLVASFL